MSLVFPHTFVPWFRAVAPYIHAYHGKTFVVAMTGEAIAAGKLTSFAQDLSILQAMGVRIVLVHGFRPQVSEQLRAKGHPERFSHGIRVTDPVALDSAQEAAGQIRFEVEAAFSQGLPNTPMANARVRVASGNFITARPVGIVDGVDFQLSGLVRKVDAQAIHAALASESIVLLSPFGFSPTGEAFNLSMEDVATATAIAVKADKLLFLTEVPGVPKGHLAQLEAARRAADAGAGPAGAGAAPVSTAEPAEPAASAAPAGGDADESPAMVTELSVHEAERIVALSPRPPQPGTPAYYLQFCVRACRGGVERSHVLPFATDGALLLEIFTHDGIGTMVVDERLESLREATIDDVGGILQLIEPFERDGTLVRRERAEIERDIGTYTVVEHDGVIFGCAALYPYPERRTAEMAALTVSPLSQGQGDGEKILKRIEHRARALGLDTIFVLTTRTMHWFIKRGFQEVDPDWLPDARKRKYNWDRRSKVLVKNLRKA